MLEYLLVILAVVFCIVGLAGCILPGLPGPPLNYAALWLLQWAFDPFSAAFLITWLVIVLVVSALDYFLPIWTARKYGATRLGIILSIAGMLLGIFLTPAGMIAGLIAGAIIGDLLSGRTSDQAVKSGIASAFGTLLSTGLKLMVSGVLAFYTFFEAGYFIWMMIT